MDMSIKQWRHSMDIFHVANCDTSMMDTNISKRFSQISESHAGSLLRKKRLGSLGTRTDDHVTSPQRDDNPDAATSPLLQRVAIIQKDERGYGLTVSGDNPVYVASVKPGGAAEKAGVQMNDKIIKVNGKLVTSSNHTEVVKLIKSGSYVALTLLGRPSHPTRDSSVIEREGSVHSVSGPQPVDAEKEREVQQQKARTLRVYFDAVQDEYEKLKKQYKANPSEKLYEKLQEKEKTLKVLEAQVKNLPCQDSGINALQTPSINVDSDAVTTDVNTPPSWPMKRESKSMKATSSQITMHGGQSVNPPRSGGANVCRSKSDVSSRKTTLSEYVPQYKRTESTPEVSDNTFLSIGKKVKKSSSFKGFRRGYARKSKSVTSNTASVPASVSDVGTDSPCTSPSSSPTPLHSQNLEPGDSGIEEGSVNSVTMMNRPGSQIIGAEDDDFQSEDESDCDRRVKAPSSPFLPKQSVETGESKIFNDLNVLEKHPAHMAIFLNYVLTHHNPAPVLFYQLTGLYSHTSGAPKDLKKWAYEIHSTFLIHMAPLKVSGVSDLQIQEIDMNLMYKSEKEEVLRAIFKKTRGTVLEDVQKLLEDVRVKKEQGLIEGSHELKDQMDKGEEQKVIDRYLLPHLEKAVQAGEEDEKQVATAWALATFLRYVCHNKFSHSNMLERVPSFVTKDKQARSSRLVNFNRKSKSIKGHQFTLTHLNKSEFCLNCNKVLWGVGPQGYQCNSCDNCVHKNCIDDLHEQCQKKKNRSSTAFKKPLIQAAPIPSSDLDNPSTPATPSHPQISPQPLRGAEDSEKGLFTAQGHSVNSMVHRFENKSPERESPSRHHRKQAYSPGQGRRPSMNNSMSSLSLPTGSFPVRKGADLGRSESMKGRNDLRGDKPARRSNSDLMMDDSTLKLLHSTSSSNSSLRSMESPSSSLATLTDAIQDDSDFDVEPELPTLKQVLGEDTVRKLKPKEKKRQDVINELFYTEKSHVRNLKIMDKLFYRPMLKEQSIPQEFTKSLFPNLETMIHLHSSLNKAMKERREEKSVISTVGDILLQRFDGEAGENFRNGCAIFCRNQSHTLEQLKVRVRKEPKTAQLLTEAENNPLCRRLALKDHIPKQFMRLTKYPLLIENLLKYTPSNSEEYSNLERAHKCSKHILEYVNQAVKDCENHQRLIELQRKIDKKSIDNSPDNDDLRQLDLTKHKLIHDGSLTWIINNRKQIDVHLILLEKAMVLLQKQEDRLVLKLQGTQLVSGKTDSKRHSPLLWLNNVLARNDATDKKAFFVVNTSKAGPQIYKLVANSADEQKTWTKYITQSSEASKRNEINMKKQPPPKDEPPKTEVSDGDGKEAPNLDNGTLVHPGDVQYSDPVISTAVQVITPLEKLRQNDENLAAVLEERQGLIAELLNVNPADIGNKVQDVLDDDPHNPQHLIAVCQHQTSQILDMMKESSPTPDSGEKFESIEDLTLPIPMDKLRDMANRMNQILTNLLAQTRATTGPISQAAVNSRDEERDRLRRELKFAQEELDRLRRIQRLQLEAERTKSESGAGEEEEGGEKKERPASLASDDTGTETETDDKEESEQDVNEDNMPGLPIEPDLISESETLNETSPSALDSMVDSDSNLHFDDSETGVEMNDNDDDSVLKDGYRYDEDAVQNFEDELNELEPPDEDQIEDMDPNDVIMIGTESDGEDDDEDDDEENVEDNDNAGDKSDDDDKECEDKDNVTDNVDGVEDDKQEKLDEANNGDGGSNTGVDAGAAPSVEKEDVIDRLKGDTETVKEQSDADVDDRNKRCSSEVFHDALEETDTNADDQVGSDLTVEPGGCGGEGLGPDNVESIGEAKTPAKDAQTEPDGEVNTVDSGSSKEDSKPVDPDSDIKSNNNVEKTENTQSSEGDGGIPDETVSS